MKKIMTCFLSLIVASVGFATTIVFDNKTTFPLKDQKSRIAVQWATTAKEMQKENKALIYGLKLNSDSLQIISQTGKSELDLPKNASHFRILVWSKGVGEPDLLTNWVSVVPNKTYTLEKDQLVPAALMSGVGC
ncbi:MULTISPECIES: hypothetical protein [unclassified Legionella]|uniref:hypothetical protein n=1 Tax=unclassified Legionella TaxID=2622702 RepID=UPI001E485C88|nr:hypothetical protein [Legionella sp. 31fI33]MCC5016026.1 hypothetical protein [Legionella sp. 31fI33]